MTVLQEEVLALAAVGGRTGTRLALLTAVVVACRAISIFERTRTTLTWMVERIVTTLPRTRTVPMSVAGAGLPLEMIVTVAAVLHQFLQLDIMTITNRTTTTTTASASATERIGCVGFDR